MKTPLILIMVLLATLCHATETNAIWGLKIPKVEFSESSADDVIAWIESESRRLDPKKRGVNIVSRSYSDSGIRTAISFKAEDITLYEATCIVAEVMHVRPRFMQDVVLFTTCSSEGPPVLRLTGLGGTITDAESGRPITNATFATVMCATNQVSINREGAFFGSILYHAQFRHYLLGETFLDKRNDTLHLSVSSKGYKDEKMSIYVGDNATGILDIKMTRVPNNRMQKLPAEAARGADPEEPDA